MTGYRMTMLKNAKSGRDEEFKKCYESHLDDMLRLPGVVAAQCFEFDTEDTELRGHKIAKGDWLMLCYPSGNRDEEVFEAPEEFRADRSPNQHLAFGYGAHMCIGMHLAKMEMRILWEELMPRLQSLEAAGEAKFSCSNFDSRLQSAPIRYRMT